MPRSDLVTHGSCRTTAAASGTAEVMQLAREAGYAPVVSARSEETEDTTIADLAGRDALGGRLSLRS